MLMRIITLSRKKITCLFFFLAFLAGITVGRAQCPTVTTSNQTFCDLQAPTVANLVATSNGNGVVWYATANSTTPLAPSVGLVSGEDYFADDNSGTCGIRQQVIVTIYGKPDAQSFQGPCVDNASDATIADLTATGNNIQWYSAPSGGSPLPTTTVLADNTFYYASQTNPITGCETSRRSVLVTVGVVPVPTGNPNQQFCNDPSHVPTLADIVLTSGGNHNWYQTASSAVPISINTPLVNGQSYFATTVDPPCESTTRFEVNVTLVAPNNAGGNGTRRICVNDLATTAPFNLFGLLTGTPDTTGTWSGPFATTNGSLGTVNVSGLSVAGSPYTFTYTVSSSLCPAAATTATIIVLPVPTATIAAGSTICSGSSVTTTFTGTPNATVTYNINGGGNQTIVLNASGTAVISNTYTTTTTFNLVSVASSGVPSCSQTLTGSSVITVLPLPTAAIASNVTICPNTSATITFTGTPNATVTYTVNGGGNQSIVLNGSGTAVITNSYAATTTYALVSVASQTVPVCSRPVTGTAIVTVRPLPTASVSGSSNVCPNGFATVTFTGTPNATITYTVSGGGTQTITLNAAGNASITTTYSATTTYTLVSAATAGTPSCSQPLTGAHTVTVLPLPTVTIASSTTICSGASATVTFTGTPNATVTYNINGGGSQTIVLSAAGTATITNTYSATTVFNLMSIASSGTPSCSQAQTGSITITVVPLPVATIAASTSVCPGGSATVTFTGTPNATVTYNINGGGNQTIILNASGTAAITNTYSATTIFNLVSVAASGTPSCPRPQTGSVTITVIPPPTVAISGSANVCPNSNATVTFTGTPNATITYTATGLGTQTIVLNAAGTATISDTYSTTTTYTLVSAATAGTPSCSQPASGTVTITVVPLPTVSIAADATICVGGSATVTFTGTANAIVTYSINGGGSQTITLNASGTAAITSTYAATTVYTLVSVASSGTPSCSQPQTGTATVTVVPPPTVAISSSATICSGDSATVTFTGTPNATVTYNINGGGSQTILLNAAGTASITNTYTATTIFNLVSIVSSGTPGCSQPQTGSITITVLPLPTVTITASTTICSGSSATVTFTGTPNATVTYTVNGGGNQTILLNASGTATIVNTYTTTTTFALVSIATAGVPSCSQPQTGTVAITVLQLPTATIAANATICAGGTATITFTGTPNATVTYSVSGGGNQTIVLNGTGTGSVTNTFSSTTIYTLVSVATTGSPGCSKTLTGSVTITVIPLPVVTIASSVTVCSGGSATVTFTGTPNATVTYTVNGGSNQTLVLDNSGNAAITNTYTATTIYNLVSVSSAGSPTCSQPQTGSITITVIQIPVVSIAANTTICSGDSATVTFTGTANAIVTYTIGTGPNQTIVLDGSGTATITNTYTTTTTISLVSVATSGTPSCSQPQTATVTITVLPLPIAAVTGNISICGGDSATVTFTGTPNATVTYTITPGGTQIIVLNNAGTATLTANYTSSTVITLVSVASAGTPSCSQPITGTVTITVIPLPVVTMTTATTTICSGTPATVTFTGPPNTVVTYNINSGADQTITLTASGTATLTNTYTATAIFTITNAVLPGTPTCSQPSTQLLTISVAEPPIVSITGDATVCAGDSATVTFNGTANAIVTYTVNGGGSQTITLDATGTASITGSYSTTTIYTLVSVATLGSPGCSQSQTGTVTITVLPLPTVSITTSTSICIGDTNIIAFNGTPGATVTYTINNGGNQTVILDASGTASTIATFVANGTITLVSVQSAGTPTCIRLLTDVLIVIVNPLPTVTISGNATICAGTNASVIFNGTPNSTVNYTVNGSPHNMTIGATGIAILNAPYSITSVINLVSIQLSNPPGCVQLQTGTVTINVIQPPNAGSNAVLALCGNNAPQDLFPLLGATAQAGGTWSPPLASGTSIFNPAVDVSGTYTYTVIATPPCVNDTASATVTVVPQTDAGIDGIANLCSNADAVDLISFLGGTPQPGGTWTPALPSGTGVFNPNVDAAGVYTYTVTGVFPCVDDTSTVTVNITPGPDAGISGSATFCVNSAPRDLFLSLGGTPQVGGTWSPAMASGTGLFNPAVDPAGVYTYTFSGNQPCDDDTATVTVTINPIPDAGQDGTAIFCSNYAPADLFANLGGTPQLGGTWTPPLASGTGVFNPLVDLGGTYTYTVGGGLCATDTADVTVTVFPSPNAGGLGATLSISSCISNTSVDLFAGLNGTQGVGIWSDDDATGALTGNIFNPSLVAAGTYHFTYTVSGGISPCLTDTATVTVVVSPIPDSGTFTGIQSFCTSVGTVDLATLLTGNQSGGTWTDSNNNPTPNVINIASFAPLTYSYSYTITNNCGTDTETVQFTILPNPVLNLPNVSIASPICKGQDPTVSFSSMTDGTYTINYDLSVSNILTGLTANLTISGGVGSFNIPAAVIPNTGITTVTFLNIASASNSCSTVVADVSANFIVRDSANLENSNLNITNFCFGSDATVIITNAIGLPDGNYTFNFNLPLGMPTTGTTGIVAIASGMGQFTIPASHFPVAGNYVMSISAITSLSGGCDNLTETAATAFQILPTPDISGASLSAAASCVNFSNEVFITGANNLTDGNYTISYQLTGANTATSTTTVAFLNGSGSFTIPASDLINSGDVTVSIDQVNSGATLCGTPGTAFTPITFAVSQLPTPTINENGNKFCADDKPTVSDLSANIQDPETVAWYDALTGGNTYLATDLLTDGTTYYATLISGSGCESATRLAVTVDLSECPELVDILIPDGFSPNNDGTNDTFTIRNLRDNYPNFKLEIYNRYGNILYKGTTNSPDWNGTTTEGGIKIGDSQVPVGVYFYILEFNDGVRKPKQGRVYLSR